MTTVIRTALALTILAPMASVVMVGLLIALGRRRPTESTVARVVGAGLVGSVLAGFVVLAVFLGAFGAPVRGDVEFGDWLRLGDFVIPAVLLVDGISLTLDALQRAADGGRRALLPHVPAQGAGLHPLLHAARRVRHRHATGGAGRRAGALLRRLGADRRVVGALHRVLPRARRAGALVGAGVHHLPAVRRRVAHRHRVDVRVARVGAVFGAERRGAPASRGIDGAGVAVPAVGHGQVGAAAVLGVAAARHGRPDALERAVLRRRLDSRRPLPAAAGLAGARGVAGRQRRRHLRRSVDGDLRSRRGARAHRCERARWRTPRWLRSA